MILFGDRALLVLTCPGGVIENRIVLPYLDKITPLFRAILHLSVGFLLSIDLLTLENTIGP